MVLKSVQIVSFESYTKMIRSPLVCIKLYVAVIQLCQEYMDFLKLINPMFLFILLFLSLVQLPISWTIFQANSCILVGNTQFTVKNSSEFVELILSIKHGISESEVSFDAMSRFTSVPLETAKTIVADQVGNVCTLKGRTSLTMLELVKALNICLQSLLFCVQLHHL